MSTLDWKQLGVAPSETPLVRFLSHMSGASSVFHIGTDIVFSVRAFNSYPGESCVLRGSDVSPQTFYKVMEKLALNACIGGLSQKGLRRIHRILLAGSSRTFLIHTQPDLLPEGYVLIQGGPDIFDLFLRPLVSLPLYGFEGHSAKEVTQCAIESVLAMLKVLRPKDSLAVPNVSEVVGQGAYWWLDHGKSRKYRIRVVLPR